MHFDIKPTSTFTARPRTGMTTVMTMTWLVPEADNQVATTIARGQHDILFDSNMPPLRQFTPFFPWKDGPTPNSCILKYAAAASYAWSMLKCSSDSSAATEEVFSTILSPATMSMAALQMASQGFMFSAPARDWTDAVTKTRHFVSSRKDDGAARAATLEDTVGGRHWSRSNVEVGAAGPPGADTCWAVSW